MDMDEKRQKDLFDTDSEAYMLLNSMIRIAKDLERLLIATYACGGLLGLIAFMMLVRLMIGR